MKIHFPTRKLPHQRLKFQILPKPRFAFNYKGAFSGKRTKVKSYQNKLLASTVIGHEWAIYHKDLCNLTLLAISRDSVWDCANLFTQVSNQCSNDSYFETWYHRQYHRSSAMTNISPSQLGTPSLVQIVASITGQCVNELKPSKTSMIGRIYLLSDSSTVADKGLQTRPWQNLLAEVWVK